ncbi:MAG: succinate dehydrogenase cytochrome b subunit [Bacteroidales bacterium]
MARFSTSSIGKKFFMSITGLFLIVFLTLHLTINSFALFSGDAFNAGCEFMALPFVTIIVPILALGFLLHITYATYLTITNIKARGNDRYEVANKTKASWASKNMFVLGTIILGMIIFHLTHFWAKMQLQDFIGADVSFNPYLLMLQTFKPWWVCTLYIVWFAAIWFHLTHGFWSAFHTIGWNNDIWIKRLKIVSYVFATILFLGFTAVAVNACIKGNDTELMKQLMEQGKNVAELAKINSIGL